MIVRMWEARAVEGRLGELETFVLATAWPVLEGSVGFLGGELFRSYDEADPRLVLITRWAGEEALEAFAGAGWRDQPVLLAGEAELMARPPHVWHFVPVGTPA